MTSNKSSILSGFAGRRWRGGTFTYLPAAIGMQRLYMHRTTFALAAQALLALL
jgi:hypothetical protein